MLLRKHVDTCIRVASCADEAYIVNAAEDVVGHIDLEHEEGADDKDDDGVHVGRCEGGLEAADCRVDHGR